MDLKDFHKYVEIAAKKTQKPNLPANGHARLIEQEPLPVTVSPAEAITPRKGRGPRIEETREELLERLLDPTLTLEETARILEVCPTTVRRYTNKGILPHERSAGNQRRFKLSAVKAFLDAQSRTTEEAQG